MVSIADLAVSNHPAALLTTYSLGTCLGVAIYDPVAHVGGLLNTMLPDSSIDPGKAVSNPAMFIDTGVPRLFRAAYDLRAEKSRLQVFVAGAAQLLDNSGLFNIGKQNFDALSALLVLNNLTIHAQHIGGHANRSMHLNLATGVVSIKISGQAKEIILCPNSMTS